MAGMVAAAKARKRRRRIAAWCAPDAPIRKPTAVEGPGAIWYDRAMFTQKIVAPTDFSPASALALDAAALLAKQFGAKVVLLYVYDPVNLSPLYAVPGAAELFDVAPRIPEFEERIRREMDGLRRERLAAVPEVEFLIKQHPNAAEGICEAAGEIGADLVVLSTHGRTGLSHMLIGSVAERVVRHAPCPVLTLRSKAK
jgi:nucleotide-binding universal stress UspA family protein